VQRGERRGPVDSAASRKADLDQVAAGIECRRQQEFIAHGRDRDAAQERIDGAERPAAELFDQHDHAAVSGDPEVAEASAACGERAREVIQRSALGAEREAACATDVQAQARPAGEQLFEPRAPDEVDR